MASRLARGTNRLNLIFTAKMREQRAQDFINEKIYFVERDRCASVSINIFFPPNG